MLVFLFTCDSKLTVDADSEDEKERFRNHPEEFDKYCRDVEGELNKRFTLVRSSPFKTADCDADLFGDAPK